MKPTYVLGTATSHDGSACLLKDGKISIAIEKERVTRLKHDGGNDNIAIEYCLNHEGITLDQVDLVVQNDNFSSFKFGNDFFEGDRLLKNYDPNKVTTISHHLAHAYSTIGTCPYEDFNIIVMDGCGNSFEDCSDIHDGVIPNLHQCTQLPHLFFEKDSYYSYKNGECKTLFKDFSEWGHYHKYPLYPRTTKHSIGGLYEGISLYCFGNMADHGKLMGLAPYGTPGAFSEELFQLKDGRCLVNYEWMHGYVNPVRSYLHFKKNFQYYADIALGVQKEVERAVIYIINQRLTTNPCQNLCYAGGTALNAVANNRILNETQIDNIYMQPAAGDNGLALGCAFYGWLEILKKERIPHNSSTFFGVKYSDKEVNQALEDMVSFKEDAVQAKRLIDMFFELIKVQNNSRYFKGLIFTIQFDIKQYGVYQLHLSEGKLDVINSIEHKHTSLVSVESDLFLKGIFDLKILMSSKSGVEISSMNDLNLLFQMVSFDSIAAQLKESDLVKSQSSCLKYYQSENYIEEVARLLNEGKVIGWFQGGSEFGPRSLGHRAILANPKNPNVKAFINKNVKFREDFRPFAPSVAREDVYKYFEQDRESPYMILVDQVREEWKDKISSVVHVDGSCRIQTVTSDWNEEYYLLLKEFEKLSGISVLLNTSFNKRGMPIVETPQDAISFFNECHLDVLVINNFIVTKIKSTNHEISAEENVNYQISYQ